MLTFAERQIALKRISSSKIEQDPLEIQTAVNDVVQAVLTDPDFQPRAFACAGLAGQPSSIVARNRKTGGLLNPVLNWHDRRATDYLKPLVGIANSSEQNASYLLEGTMNGAGAAINWTIEHWKGPDVVANLTQWLDEVVSPSVFVNIIGGLGSPVWCSEQNSNFLGIRSIGEKAVPIINSILFLLTINLEVMSNAGQSTGIFAPQAAC